MARTTRSLTAAAVAAVIGATGVSAPASAATVPHWLRPKVMPIEHADNFTEVAASGWRNIWAGGMANVEGDDGIVPIWHWNGTKWARVAAPAGFGDQVTDLTTGGAGNTWALGTGLYRRTGGRWVSAGAHGTDVTAIGAVGANGLFAAYPGGVRYYDGSSWRSFALPAKASVTTIRVASRTNAWAVGTIRTGETVRQPFAAHWNGTTWTRTATPKVGAGPEGNSLTISDAATVGAKTAFISGQLITSETDFQTVLLRWNGSRWARVAAPPNAKEGMDDVAADGYGGLWAVTSSVNGVLHRTASGAWTTAKLPGAGHPSAWAVTRIPGTRRAIAGGDVEATASTWKPAIMLTN